MLPSRRLKNANSAFSMLLACPKCVCAALACRSNACWDTNAGRHSLSICHSTPRSLHLRLRRRVPSQLRQLRASLALLPRAPASWHLPRCASRRSRRRRRLRRSARARVVQRRHHACQALSPPRSLLRWRSSENGGHAGVLLRLRRHASSALSHRHLLRPAQRQALPLQLLCQPSNLQQEAF